MLVLAFDSDLKFKDKYWPKLATLGKFDITGVEHRSVSLFPNNLWVCYFFWGRKSFYSNPPSFCPSTLESICYENWGWVLHGEPIMVVLGAPPSEDKCWNRWRGNREKGYMHNTFTRRTDNFGLSLFIGLIRMTAIFAWT